MWSKMMKPIYVLCFVWLLFSLFPVMSNASASEPEAVDLESLIAGVKKGESALKSGRGHFVVKPNITEFGEQIFGRKSSEEPVELFFAFDGKKILCEQLSGAERGLLTVFDGKKQAVEIRDGRRIVVRESLRIYDKNLIRYWGLTYNKQPVGEYLEKNAIAIEGKETINDNLCYVVRARLPRTGEMKFWIAPSAGYRALKREHDTSYQSGSEIVDVTFALLIHYEKTKERIWFPKSGEEIVMGLNKTTGKKELISKYTMSVRDSELNVDVSDQFKLDIDPETKVWDHRVNRERAAREAGICPAGGK